METPQPHMPPKWASWWVDQWIEPDTAEYVLGDLNETFNEEVEELGPRIAKWNYTWSALSLTRLAFRRRKKFNQLFIPIAMYRNYTLIAFRNLLKHKFYSIVNILGLAVGLAVFLMIFLYVTDELSYNEYHSKKDQIYRVTTTFSNGNHWGVPSYPVGPVLKSDYPEILNSVRMSTENNVLITHGDKAISQDGFCLADPALLEIFDIPLLEGDPATALSSPTSIMLSEKAARIHFGDEPAMGQTMVVSRDTSEYTFLVTAIFEDLPKQSDMGFETVIPYEVARDFGYSLDNWRNWGPMTFVELHPDADPVLVEEDFTHLISERTDSKKGTTHLHLQPLRKMHLYDLKGEMGPITYIYVLSIIALFILIIACINFMNLTTARSMVRAKEIGMRKVIGARRENLIFQFYAESMFMSVLSMAIACVLVWLSLPFFNEVASKELVLADFGWTAIPYILGITLLTGLLAGSYPALLLSSYDPIAVLKGSFKFSSKGKALRKGLVVVQFTLSIMLILSTLIVKDQITYMQKKKLGFEKDQVVYIEAVADLGEKYSVMREAFAKKSGVIQVTHSSELPTSINSHCGIPQFEGKDPDKKYPFLFCMTDSGFLETFRLNLVEGEFFSHKHYSNDEHDYVLNQTAVQNMGLEDPVGKYITIWGGKGKVIGVVEDFHFESMREPVKSLVLWNLKRMFSYVSMRVKPDNISETLAEIESVWEVHMPGIPFEYHFVDETFEELYREEQVISKLFSSFAFLAIFISCLGLFGLAAFIAEQRRKEIGIRKVLGANLGQIIALLSRDFTRPVLLAFAIGTPIALFFMNDWMEGYAYRASISWVPVVIAGVAAFVVAWLTVTYQSLRAAFESPVNSLKDE